MPNSVSGDEASQEMEGEMEGAVRQAGLGKGRRQVERCCLGQAQKMMATTAETWRSPLLFPVYSIPVAKWCLQALLAPATCSHL